MSVTVVSRDDVSRFGRKLRDRGFLALGRKLFPHNSRVEEHWNRPALEKQWFDVPAVQGRWNSKITGDPALDFRRWAAAEFGLAGRALSLGSGFGHRELAWARLGVFDEIVGVDLAAQAVADANASAQAAGFDQNRLRFEVVAPGVPITAGWDAIIAEHSLHHFSDIPGTVARIHDALRPGGYFVMDEYVGPTKFQWTRGQLQHATALLLSLPEERRVMRDGRVKRRVRRPSLLAMRLDDPSEARESARILPAVRETFSVRAERGYGGSLLHPLLSNVAQHFIDDSPETRHWLSRMFSVEDELLAAGLIEHDFVAGVYQKA